MSISTLEGILAGVQPVRSFAKAITPTLVAGRPASLWYLAGAPGTGTADTATNGGVARSSSSTMVNGQIPHVDPGGSSSAYLNRFVACSLTSGLLMLMDRLWDCGNANGSTLSVTSTGAQTINSATWPARDRAGSTNGDDVLIAVEVSTILGVGTPTWTLTYTNQAGTGSHTTTNLDAVVASSAVGAFYRLGLQAGDTGVRSIQTFQSNATSTSGQFVLVAYRLLYALPLPQVDIGGDADALTGGLPQIYNGVVPFLVWLPSSTTATIINGTYQEAQG